MPAIQGTNKDEKGRERDRIITPEEFASILEQMKRPVQRVLVCLYETGMRKEEAVKLMWDRIDEKMEFIPAAGFGHKVKEAAQRSNIGRAEGGSPRAARRAEESSQHSEPCVHAQRATYQEHSRRLGMGYRERRR